MTDSRTEEPEVKSDSFPAAEWLLAVLLAVSSAIILILLYRRKRKKEQVTPVTPVQISPGERTLSTSEIASAASYGELLGALQSFLRARLNIPVARLNREDVYRQLTSRGLSAERVRELITAWDDCEMAVYAGAAPDKFARDRETILSVLSDI
jgi:hypothetical protein